MHPNRPRRGHRLALTIAAATALTGTALLSHAVLHPPGPPQPGDDHVATTQHTTPSTTTPPPLPPSPPTRVKIPAIHVDAPFANVDFDKDGWLQTPPAADRNLVGWYAAGTTPGATGNAILVGHVDNATGPAVFYNLGTLKPGNTINITRRDGHTAQFTIDTLNLYPKNAFPAEHVYRNTPRPELRIITCGGAYTKRTGYPDNLVVAAHLTHTE